MENENTVTMTNEDEQKKPGFFKKIGNGIAAGAKWVWHNKFGLLAGGAAGLVAGLAIAHGSDAEAPMLEEGDPDVVYDVEYEELVETEYPEE